MHVSFNYILSNIQKLKKHLAELDTIVEDAIKYLQEGVTTATDHEHLKPLAFNHVDSLLLADKVRNIWIVLTITRVKLILPTT